MQPFFSIVVTCLNAGDKLKSTLENIEKQVFRDFEVIVKDGGSKDGSLVSAYEMARRWEDALPVREADRNDGVKPPQGRKDKGKRTGKCHVRRLRWWRKRIPGSMTE